MTAGVGSFAVCLPWVAEPEIVGGGYLNTVRFAELLGRYRPTELLSYRKREEGVPFLEDEAERLAAEGVVTWITWGPDVNELVEKYHGRMPLIYYQQSLDWGIDLAADIPVVSMSRWMMANAQRDWPASPQFYLPPVLQTDCVDRGLERDIDVLVVPRKQPPYVLETLVPLLEGRCRVEVLTRFVPREELFELFNRTKVYVYAFQPQRALHPPSGWRLMEGISTQDLEALACGCSVMSDLRGGQIDFLEPGVDGFKLMSHSPAWDVEQILDAVRGFPQEGQLAHAERLRQDYGEAAFDRRVKALLRFLDAFYAFNARHPADPAAFRFPSPVSRWQLAQERAYRVKKRATRSRARRKDEGPSG